jgi:acetylornithine deacetylase/succinyl-diaminopimelate desuccinylase-like protein
MNYMVREHFAEIDAEFAMTEGGGARIDDGRVTRVGIGTAEKLPARVRLVARGTAGHGSVPRLDNALMHLGAAVDKVGRWETPMRLNDTTRAYFEKMAVISAPERASIYKALLDPKTAAGAQKFLRERSPGEYSMLRTSVVPTILKAGVGANVIPSEAEATLDIRALPDENIDAFYAEMGKVIGDPAVAIERVPQTRPPSPASKLDTDMYRAMERAAATMYPGATVIPSMSTGASDQAQLRARGIQSYGIGPASTESDETNYPAHGDVERLAESSLYPFVQYMWNVIIEVAAHK